MDPESRDAQIFRVFMKSEAHSTAVQALIQGGNSVVTDVSSASGDQMALFPLQRPAK